VALATSAGKRKFQYHPQPTAKTVGSGAMWVMESKRAHFYSEVFLPTPKGLNAKRSNERSEIRATGKT